MDKLLKVGIGAGIVYAMYQAFAAQMANPTGPAQPASGATPTLTPNYQLTPARTTIFPPGITPAQQAELDAFDHASGQLTDKQASQIFGWQSFNDWYNSLTTQNQANNVKSGANPSAAAYGTIRTAPSGRFGAQAAFDNLDRLTSQVF